MKFGYARVSTQNQNLDLQVDALQKEGCDEIVEEKVSGAHKKREKLDDLFGKLRQGDTLVVYKLDRLGRSTKQLIELSEWLDENDIELVSIRDSIDTSTPMGRAMMRMLMVLAEMEREIIVERTQAGLKAARKRGRVGGRPSKDKKDVERAIKLYESGEYSVPEIEEMTGVSKPSLYRYLKKKQAQAQSVE
ncbi:DNA invertase Pin-like site-specific DNA recombinase [Alkalibacillus flavidus]|uniref:DNA invertase Pin-like site-specific DNA recombinase n=1 Tax=Alkalibacillus flavidus TaxID=546021 RepID=A0ABV2KVP3_9BACI